MITALFGLALTTSYWPGITGAATTPRWDVAALLAVALFFAPRVRMTAVHWLGLALIAWFMATLIWSEGRFDGIDVAYKLILAGVAFAIGSTMRSLRPLLIGAAIGIGISSAIAIAQWQGWEGIEVSDHRFAGLFYNRDRLGAAAAIVAIGVLATRRLWPLLPLMLPALILTGSRAAWLAVVAGFMTMPVRPDWLKWSLRVAALAGVVVILVLRGHDIGIDQRFALAGDTISSLNVFGHGLGSFWESFPAHAHLFSIATERPDHPHNELLWLAYEGGLLAFAMALALCAVLWRAAEEQPERAVLAGVLVLSFFAMPLHDPATLILGAIVAGFCAADRSVFCDAAYDRGSALRAGVASDLGQRRAV